ncbi:MAG: OstA-like protein, partial [Candidatus Kapaibacterium sp.]
MSKLYMFFLIIFLWANSAIAQPREPIILDTADVLLGSTQTDAGHVRRFMGNVRLHQGKVRVHADEVIHYIDQNRAKLIGNVRILQDDMTMSAPRIDYDGNKKFARAEEGVRIVDSASTLVADSGSYSTRDLIADFRGEVVIEDDSARIIANRVIYYRKSGNSDATGDVVIRGKYSNTALAGDTVNYIPNENYTRAAGAPKLFQIDTLRSGNGDSIRAEIDTLSIRALIMHAWRSAEAERYVFDDSVEINRSGMAARADSAVYFKSADRIELFGGPVVWYDSTQLHADTTIIR